MKSTVHGYRVEFVENVNMIFKKTFLLRPLNFDHHIHAEEKVLISGLVALINIVVLLMMSAKLATLGLLKIKLFSNKDYDIIISVHDITNKILSHNSYYIVDAVM